MTRILLLRPKESSRKLYNKLVKMGFEVVNIPIARVVTIIGSSVSYKNILKKYDYLIFTTQIGVKIFFKKLMEDELWDQFLNLNKESEVVAIGPQTKKTIERYGLKTTRLPRKYTSKGLIELFDKVDLVDKNILLIRSIHADKSLERFLRDRGADTTLVYTHRLMESDKALDAVKLILEGDVDSVVFTSSILVDIIQNNLSMHGLSLTEVSSKITIFSIGPLTSNKLREYGVEDFIEAYPHDSEGLSRVIEAYYRVM